MLLTTKYISTVVHLRWVSTVLTIGTGTCKYLRGMRRELHRTT